MNRKILVPCLVLLGACGASAIAAVEIYKLQQAAESATATYGVSLDPKQIQLSDTALKRIDGYRSQNRLESNDDAVNQLILREVPPVDAPPAKRQEGNRATE